VPTAKKKKKWWGGGIPWKTDGARAAATENLYEPCLSSLSSRARQHTVDRRWLHDLIVVSAGGSSGVTFHMVPNG
jgi:hypothetical protein